MNIFKKLFFVIKYPQNLSKDTKNGAIGGTVGNYLNLKNEFMITFWFKYFNNNNSKFPFITIFDSNTILKEYIFYNLENLIYSYDDSKNYLNFCFNKIYFCKIEFKIINSLINIKWILFEDYSKFKIIENNITSYSKINDFIFLINRLELDENILIEKLIFYDSIENFSDYEWLNGVSDILYFINFKHNYPYTKWISNEINNEFGPCLNGSNSFFTSMFNANFDDNNKEILWETTNRYWYLYFNPILKNYFKIFILNKSFNIYLKFDIFIDYLNEIKQHKIFDLAFLQFFTIKLGIFHFINKDTLDIQKKFYIIDKKNKKHIFFNKTIPGNTKINGINFFNGNFIGLKYIILNFYKRDFENNIFNFISYISFKKNSPFCNNNICLFKNIVNVDILIDFIYSLSFGNIVFYLKGKNYNGKISFIIKEFSIGIGNLTVSNENLKKNKLYIESKNIINLVLICNNDIDDLERRNSLYQNKEHIKCNDDNCSICRKDINICEYCYKNYYLSSGNCILNQDNTKFVNSYSLLRNKDLNVKTYTNLKVNYKNYYYVNFNTNSFNKYYIFNLNFIYELNNPKIRINYFNSDSCSTKFYLYYNKSKSNWNQFNVIFPINDYNCIKKFWIRSNKFYFDDKNSLKIIDFSINKEEIDCNKKYKDLFCDLGCHTNSDYLTKFDNSLYYSTCEINDLDYLLKNNFLSFKYYSNCPFHCIKCLIENYLIKCSICEKGYYLKNYECLLKNIVDCNIENEYNISNNHTNINLYTCEKICNFINKSTNKVKNMIRYYKNKNNCNDHDVIIGYCKNKLFESYNCNKKLCINCFNENCLNFNCNNCDDTNIYSPCSKNFILYKNYLCIKDEYYDLNCLEYFKYDNYKCIKCKNEYYLSSVNKCILCDNNCLTCINSSINCVTCKNSFYLHSDNKCHQRNTNHCLIYINNSHICSECKIGYFLNNLNECKECNKYCKSCFNNKDFCTSCNIGYKLNILNCVLDKSKNKYCLKYSEKNVCIICKEGYFLNYLNICEKCNINCDKCKNLEICLKCNNNFVLKNDKCFIKPNNCLTVNKNNIKLCDKCNNGYFLNKNICLKCNNNCKECINFKNNCISCNDDNKLYKFEKLNHCEFKCLKTEIFNKEKITCNKCYIEKIKEFKLFNNNMNNEYLDYNFKINLSDEKYFYIIDIPYYIDLNKTDNINIKENISIKLNNTFNKFDYNISIDNINKKIALIPLINSYKENLNIILIINKNIFSNLNKCEFENEIFKFNLKNFNKKDYKNEIIINENKYFPKLNENSKEYKDIKKYTNVIDSSTENIMITNFFLSFINRSILSKLSFLMPQLLVFYYLSFLNINLNKNLNTFFSLLKFNSKTFNIETYLNLSKNLIELRNNKLLIKVKKLSNYSLLKINLFTYNFIIIIFICLFFIIYFIINFLKNIIIIIYFKYFMKQNSIKNKIIKNYNNSIKNYKFKNILNNKIDNNFKKDKKIDLFKKFKFKKISYKVNKILDNLKNLLFTFLLSLLINEIPNIIFIILLYVNNLNFEFLNITNIIINLIVISNIILFHIFLYYNFKYLKKFYNKKNLETFKKEEINYINIFIPVIPKSRSIIIFFKIIDISRITLILIIILYLYQSILIQIVLIIIIQIIYLSFIYKFNNLEIFFIILLIKEFILWIYLFCLISLSLIKESSIINYIIFIIFIVILFISIIEFVYNIVSKFIKGFIKFKRYLKEVINRIRIKKKIFNLPKPKKILKN